MAIYCYNNAYITIATVDLSDHAATVTIDTGVETLDSTAMGSGTRTMIGGLATWTVTVEFFQDFAASKVDATIASLTNRLAALVIKPNGGTTGATNPKWTGTGLLSSYNPLSGSVGDIGKTSLSFVANTALVRAEAD